MYGLEPNPLQPPWAPSGTQDVDSATYHESACGQRELRVAQAVNVPGRREPVIVHRTIAVPHLPYVNMLDPRGNVGPVVIGNNRVARQGSVSYRSAILNNHRREGWVRWDFLPSGSLEIEPAQFGLSPEQWAEKREQMRDERMAAASVEAKAYEIQGGSDNKDLIDALKGNNEALARVLDKVVEQLHAGVHAQAQAPVPPVPPAAQGGQRRAKGDAGAE